jgi:hypothetical protein
MVEDIVVEFEDAVREPVVAHRLGPLLDASLGRIALVLARFLSLLVARLVLVVSS